MNEKDLNLVAGKLPLSASTIKRNRDTAVGQLQTKSAKPIDRRKGQHCQLDKSSACVEVRCVLTSYRKKLLDEHDSLPQSFKRLVDAIASDLGVPDNDPRLVWRFHQVKTDGEEGVIVSIRRNIP